jgi:hypothetical protein
MASHGSCQSLRAFHLPCPKGHHERLVLCCAFSLLGLLRFAKKPSIRRENKTKEENKMKNVIEKILKAHGLLEIFVTSTDFHARIENEPYLPLSIEKHGKTVTVTHYSEQNGDLIANPDMEFEVTEIDWSPRAIQHADGSYFQAIIYRDGKKLINLRQFKAQKSFAKLWSRNLISQGFDKPKSGATAKCSESN